MVSSLEDNPVRLMEHTEILPLCSDVHCCSQRSQNQCFLWQ